MMGLPCIAGGVTPPPPVPDFVPPAAPPFLPPAPDEKPPDVIEPPFPGQHAPVREPNRPVPETTLH